MRKDVFNLEELSRLWEPQFEVLSAAGEEYDPRNWEKLWPGHSARWTLKFLLSAAISSNDSTCFNRKTGAALVDIKKQRNKVLAPFILSSCFNGAPTGISPCTSLGYCAYKRTALEDFCRERKINREKPFPEELKGDFKKFKDRYLHFCQAMHAEANAIYFSPTNAHGKMLFATTNPCPSCARILVQNGIGAVIYSTPYKFSPSGRPLLAEETRRLFEEAKVACVQLPIPKEYINFVLQITQLAGQEIRDKAVD